MAKTTLLAWAPALQNVLQLLNPCVSVSLSNSVGIKKTELRKWLGMEPVLEHTL